MTGYRVADVIDRPSVTPDDLARRAIYVDKARALAPLLAKNARLTDQDRNVAAENIEALQDAGLYRLLRPARFGGIDNIDSRTTLDVQMELARECAATSWVYGLGIATSFSLALFPMSAQEAVWGENNDARICAVTSTLGTSAEREVGGWRVNGKYRYVSGSAHAQWIMLSIPYFDESGRKTGIGMGLVPRESIEIEESWFIAGMRGTASNTVVVDNLFIPDEMVMEDFWGMLSNSETNPYPDTPLFRANFRSLWTMCLAATPVGTAAAAVDHVIEVAPKRLMPEFDVSQAEEPTNQFAIGRAAQSISSAYLHLYLAAAATDEAMANAVDLDELSNAQVAVDSVLAARHAREALRTVTQAHGSASFADSSPLQRMWRDVEVASSHLNFYDAYIARYGASLLGQDLGGTMNA